MENQIEIIISNIEFKDNFGNPQSYAPAIGGVKQIKEHSAQGEGDRWYYHIEFDNGNSTKLFSFERVDYFKK